MLAHLVEAAQSQVTHGIEAFNAKFHHHHHHHEEVTDVVPNGSIVISQNSGMDNFTMLSTGTYADPDPIKTANTEKFYVQGVWLPNKGQLLDKVIFTCDLQGVQVFKQEFPCKTGDQYCPLPDASQATWNGMFTFDVPGFAPPFEYDVHVKAYQADGTTVLFDLESKFRI